MNCLSQGARKLAFEQMGSLEFPPDHMTSLVAPGNSIEFKSISVWTNSFDALPKFEMTPKALKYKGPRFLLQPKEPPTFILGTGHQPLLVEKTTGK
jgi:hypothetical protein